jgi:pyrimidine-nucleoside phosphorylase
LQGKVKGDLLTVALALAAGMLKLAGLASGETEAMDKLIGVLESGQGLERLGQIIAAQGGNAGVIHDTSLMPKAAHVENVYADKSGILSEVDCRGLGTAACMLGAGRVTKDDIIDLSVGFVMKKRLGDSVATGEALCEVHSNDADKLAQAKKDILGCMTIADRAEKPTLIYEYIS